MKMRLKWAMGIGIVVLAVSLTFNWFNNQKLHGFAVNTQASFMEGDGFISQADYLLAHGDSTHAILDAYEGIGFLQSSSGGMDQVGVHGVAGLAMFLNVAMYSLLGYTNPGEPADSIATKQQYQKVIQVFIDASKPIGAINYGSISNSQLKHVIDQVYQAMTPQERRQFHR